MDGQRQRNVLVHLRDAGPNQNLGAPGRSWFSRSPKILGSYSLLKRGVHNIPYLFHEKKTPRSDWSISHRQRERTHFLRPNTGA